MRCFSRILISNVHKSIIVMNSIDTRFSRNVLEAIQKTRSTCFVGFKTTRLRLVVLNPIKRSCSFFNSFIAELAKQWMSFCRDGQNGVSKICVDGCDVLAKIAEVT